MKPILALWRGWPPIAQIFMTQPHYSVVDAVTLKSWLHDADEIALLDVREHGQYGEGHPFFAVPLPYSRLELEIGRLVPRTSTRIILADDGDGVAQSAAAALGVPLIFLHFTGVASPSIHVGFRAASPDTPVKSATC